MKTAKTKDDYKYGLLRGINRFKFSNYGPHKMTMSPGGYTIPFPVYYEGYKGKNKVDSGIAYPGQDFYVKGNVIKEYPMMKRYKAQYGMNINLDPVTIQDKSIGQKWTPPGLRYLPERDFTKIPFMTSTIPTPTTFSDFGQYKTGLGVDEPQFQNFNLQPPPYDDSFGPLGGSEQGQKKWWNFAGNTSGDALANTLMYAPGIINTARGLFSKTKDYKKFYNPHAGESLSVLRNLKYRPDYTQEIMAQNKMFSDTRSGMGSSAARAAMLAAGNQNLNRLMREEDRNAQGINNQYASQYAQSLYDYGASKAAENARNQMLKIQADAAKDQILQTGLTQLQAAGMKTAEYKNRSKEMKDAYDLIGQQYNNYGLTPYNILQQSGYDMGNATQFKGVPGSQLYEQYQNLEKQIEELRGQLSKQKTN